MLYDSYIVHHYSTNTKFGRNFRNFTTIIPQYLTKSAIFPAICGILPRNFFRDISEMSPQVSGGTDIKRTVSGKYTTLSHELMGGYVVVQFQHHVLLHSHGLRGFRMKFNPIFCCKKLFEYPENWPQRTTRFVSSAKVSNQIHVES